MKLAARILSATIGRAVPRYRTLGEWVRRSDLEKLRFDDVWDGHLHIEQAKTGARLALPLALHLDAIGVSIGQAIEDCRNYAVGNEWVIRKHSGDPLVLASLSARFEEAREAALPVFKEGVHPHFTNADPCQSACIGHRVSTQWFC